VRNGAAHLIIMIQLPRLSMIYRKASNHPKLDCLTYDLPLSTVGLPWPSRVEYEAPGTIALLDFTECLFEPGLDLVSRAPKTSTVLFLRTRGYWIRKGTLEVRLPTRKDRTVLLIVGAESDDVVKGHVVKLVN